MKILQIYDMQLQDTSINFIQNSFILRLLIQNMNLNKKCK